MFKKMLLVSGSLLLLAACDQAKIQEIMEKDAAEQSSDAMMKDDDKMMDKDDAMMDDEKMMEDDKMEDDKMEGDTMMKGDDKMMENDDASMAADGETMMMEGEDAMMDDEKMMEDDKMEVEASGQYLAYSDGVIGNGESSVLFFKAPWCPSCKKNDGILTELYGKGGASLNTYKIDYDTATELKKQYGITSQDTFVLIDGSGKAVSSVTFPSESALLALVQ